MSLKNQKFILILSGMALLTFLAGVSYVYLLRTQASSSESIIVSDPKLPPPTDQKKMELVFLNFMVFNEDSISLDGGDLRSVACAQNRDQNRVFGTIDLNDDTVADLSCLKDYMGGIDLIYLNIKGEKTKKKLATKDGDAGDTWDTRSWVTRDLVSRNIIIQTVTFFSSVDTSTGNLNTCRLNFQSRMWDPEARDFIEIEHQDEFELSDFSRPINVDTGCLDKDGHWNLRRTQASVQEVESP